MDTDTTTTETPPTRRRTIIASLRALFLTLLLLAVAWFGLRYVLTPLVFSEQPAPVAVADHLEERIQILEEKWRALEAKEPPPMPDIAALEARIATLEQAPKNAPAEAAAVLNHEEIAMLKEEMERIKSSEHATLRSIILISQLQEAMRAGRPFANELSALMSLRPEMKEHLAPLEATGVLGVATLAQLQEQFAHAIAPALAAKGEGKTLVQNLRSLVKIRKIGEAQSGADDQAVIARAEAKLAKADVAGALQEVGALSPHAAPNFAPWQERAKIFLAAQAVLDRLQHTLAAGVQE